jgi:MFS family permease
MTTTFRANIQKAYLFEFLISLHFIGAVLVPFFIGWGKISFTEIMLLQSWFMLWIFLLEIPTGTIADRFGRKFSLVLAAAVNVAAALVYPLAPNFYLFMLGEFLWALASSLMSGAKEAFVYDSLKKIGESEKSKQVFGKLGSAGNIGILIGSPIGGLIAVYFGLNAPMFFCAIPFTLAFFVGLTFKEPKIKIKSVKKNYIEILKKGMRFFYKHRILKILTADMIAIATISYFMIWLFQPLLMQAGVGIEMFGFVHAAFVLSQILIMTNFERLELFFRSKKNYLLFSAVITGIFFIIGGLTSWLPVVLAVIIIGGGFGLSRSVLLVNYMNKYVPSPQRATVLSTVSMFRRLALVIVNPFVGLLVDWSLNNTLIILGAAALIFSLVSKVEEKHLIA